MAIFSVDSDAVIATTATRTKQGGQNGRRDGAELFELHGVFVLESKGVQSQWPAQAGRQPKVVDGESRGIA